MIAPVFTMMDKPMKTLEFDVIWFNVMYYNFVHVKENTKGTVRSYSYRRRSLYSIYAMALTNFEA